MAEGAGQKTPLSKGRNLLSGEEGPTAGIPAIRTRPIGVDVPLTVIRVPVGVDRENLTFT